MRLLETLLISTTSPTTPTGWTSMTSSEETMVTSPPSEVSKSSHDIVMGDSMSSDVSPMDLDGLDTSAMQADVDDQVGHSCYPPALASSRPGLLLGVEVPVPLLAIEDAKSEEYYKTAGVISGGWESNSSRTLRHEWVHSRGVQGPVGNQGESASRWLCPTYQVKRSTITPLLTSKSGDHCQSSWPHAIAGWLRHEQARSIRGGIHLVHGR